MVMFKFFQLLIQVAICPALGESFNTSNIYNSTDFYVVSNYVCNETDPDWSVSGITLEECKNACIIYYDNVTHSECVSLEYFNDSLISPSLCQLSQTCTINNLLLLENSRYI